MVCGPTASGKSAVADELAERLSLRGGGIARTAVVDSMQVYREIPTISNQARRRPAELVGCVSVIEEWTVGRHRAAVDALLAEAWASPTPPAGFVLDVGTGMYLNAILMDIDLAPKVDPSVRAEASRQTRAMLHRDEHDNARRQVRRRELELVGVAARGSIWTPKMRVDADILYLRPPRVQTDAVIARRTRGMVRDGIEEARLLVKLASTGALPTPQVMGSIGVRELIEVVEQGETPGGTAAALELAEERISARTRRLARRQVRWFDKMVRTLQHSAPVTVVERPDDPRALAFIERCAGDARYDPHDTMG